MYIYISCIKDFSYDECQALWMDESMANNLLITLSTSELDIYYTNPVAFEDWIQAIKIRNWQITNAIIQYVDLRISPFLIDCFLLFSFELRAEQHTTTHNWNNLYKAQLARLITICSNATNFANFITFWSPEHNHRIICHGFICSRGLSYIKGNRLVFYFLKKRSRST